MCFFSYSSIYYNNSAGNVLIDENCDSFVGTAVFKACIENRMGSKEAHWSSPFLSGLHHPSPFKVQLFQRSVTSRPACLSGLMPSCQHNDTHYMLNFAVITHMVTFHSIIPSPLLSVLVGIRCPTMDFLPSYLSLLTFSFFTLNDAFLYSFLSLIKEYKR